MVAQRELAIATDPYAYDEEEINDFNIAPGFNTSSQVITYQNGAPDGSAFTTLRVTSFSDNANRDVIIEEAIDQVAAASIFAGTFGANGQFEAAFRGWDFHTSKLLQGALGYQDPESVAAAGGHKAGYRYTLTMVPATLALKIVDEQATDTTGSNNVRGTTTVYRGVGITNMELSLNVKEYARATFQWVARKAETFDEAFNTNTAITGDPGIFYNAVLKWTPEGASSAETMKCKGFTMSLSRTMDQDYFFIGSEFLQGLYYNGLTDLGGSITLGAGDWVRIRTMIAGSPTGGDNVLDESRREFFGSVSNQTTCTSTVLANAIPSGKFEVVLHSPDGCREVAKITCDKAKLTEMARSLTGRNQFEKTVNWKAQINVTDKFTVEVYQP